MVCILYYNSLGGGGGCQLAGVLLKGTALCLSDFVTIGNICSLVSIWIYHYS